MDRLPQELYTASQVRELDRVAIEGRGIDGYELMQRAGRAAFMALLNRWPRTSRISVWCGSGNNGGDGYVVARLARQAGWQVSVWAVGQPKSDVAVKACQDYQRTGGDAEGFQRQSENDVDIVVDALLGTGLQREVLGDYATAIGLINDQTCPVFAIDIPSGLNSDTGRVMGSAVRADATITFIGTKIGLLTGRGRTYAGDVVFDDLAVPADAYRDIEPIARRIEPVAELMRSLRRSGDAHKGDAGRVVVVGGDHGMPGAPRLAGEAAYRAGAGLVRVVSRSRHMNAIGADCAELLLAAADDTAAVKHHLRDADVIAVGPGLGQGAWGKAMLGAVLESQAPIIADADALNLLAVEPLRHERWILTPHPGEAGRLLGIDGAQVQSDRVRAVREIARRYGGVAVLKGSGTLVEQAGQGLWLGAGGNPGMATGGMGDVLTGVIAALLAQGLALLDAAKLGVWLHGTAADCAAADGGENGLMASDLYPWIRSLCNRHDPRPSLG